MTGQLADTVASLEQAIELRRELGNQLREGGDLRLLSYVYYPLGRCAEARNAGEQAVRILQNGRPSPELAWAYMNMCQLSAYSQAGVAITADYANLAANLAEKLGEFEVGAQARFHLAVAQYTCTPEHRTQETAWAAMKTARNSMLAAGLVEPATSMAMLMIAYGATHRDHGGVGAALEVLETHAHGRDILIYQSSGRGHNTLSLLHQGCWEEATELATHILDHPLSPPIARGIPLMVLALVGALRGDPELWPLLDEAANLFESSGWILVTYAARAEAAWLEGNHVKARTEAQRGLDIATLHTDPWITGELARWMRLSDGETATVSAAPPFSLELAGNWAAAAAAWERLGCPYDAALARLSGDIPALLMSLTTFESLGARPAAAIARARLRAQGASVGNRGPRKDTRANPHGLTARQIEILTLLRDRLTGPQIAARLHISPKTADNHVTAILTKMGVRSRAEAIAAIHGNGRRGLGRRAGSWDDGQATATMVSTSS